MPVKALITILLTAPALTLGRTNYEGCTSIEGTYTPTWSGPEPWRTRFYYVPDTFEVCSRLDCGGGRAPPKYTVPGCPSYEGTSTYSPMYLELTTVEAVRGGGMTVEGVLRTGSPGDDGVVVTEVTTTTTTTTTGAPKLTASPSQGGDGDGDERSTVAGSDDGVEEEEGRTMTADDESAASTTTTPAADNRAAVPTVRAALWGCLVAGAAIMAVI